jgi:hypothetical protein
LSKFGGEKVTVSGLAVTTSFHGHRRATNHRYTVITNKSPTTLQDVVKAGVHMRKQFWITRLPRYLVLSLARFSKNYYFVEKNPTIVTFPVKNLEMKDCT